MMLIEKSIAKRGSFMKKRVFGLCAFCVGLGMVIVMVVPEIGWVCITAGMLICFGYMLLKC